MPDGYSVLLSGLLLVLIGGVSKFLAIGLLFLRGLALSLHLKGLFFLKGLDLY